MNEEDFLHPTPPPAGTPEGNGIERAMELTGIALARAQEYGLTTEVFCFALLYALNRHSCRRSGPVTPEVLTRLEAALAAGLSEWDV